LNKLGPILQLEVMREPEGIENRGLDPGELKRRARMAPRDLSRPGGCIPHCRGRWLVSE